MKEYTFEELGYFAERECEAIKEQLQGYSYMNFDITWSNCAGNCTLIVRTNYEGSEKEIKNFFLALRSWSDLSVKETVTTEQGGESLPHIKGRRSRGKRKREGHMLELKTGFGTFGNFADMARFMDEEHISEVTVEAHYIFTKVVRLYFTLEEIKAKLAAGELV